MGVFTPQNWANTTDEDFFVLYFCLPAHQWAIDPYPRRNVPKPHHPLTVFLIMPFLSQIAIICVFIIATMFPFLLLPLTASEVGKLVNLFASITWG